MNNLDFVDLCNLICLVENELTDIQMSSEPQNPQYEFDLRMLKHKLDVLIKEDLRQ